MKRWYRTMPKKIERKLKAEAKKKGLGKDRANAYVYGTLNKIEKKAKPKKTARKK